MLSLHNINSDMKQLLMLKEKIAIFEGLKEEDIVSIVDEVKILQYDKGDIIIHEGSKNSKEIYVLLRGAIEVKKINSISDRTLAKMEDKGVFGEISALTDYPRSATIVSSKNDTVIISFSIKDNDDEGRALFYRNIISELSGKILMLNGDKIDKSSLWEL